ncbi:hypothetical protein EWM64_g8701 [Hericium alpestre]|uniref:Uncharacterized protein n=1 Tax=Hericium alpestre TaxID=135208 RepID=A0A4Y9ZM24_9AGAM|nr:hypothetical protein EWM64_g8701 [Hericium alpestre]
MRPFKNPQVGHLRQTGRGAGGDIAADTGSPKGWKSRDNQVDDVYTSKGDLFRIEIFYSITFNFVVHVHVFRLAANGHVF